MKQEFSQLPQAMEGMERYGFSWMDFVLSIPSPIYLATGYKSNGKPNACLQSWSTFIGDDQGFYCIMASVHKEGHMYQSLQETKGLVLNFPSAHIYGKCAATIQNNGWEQDELALSGLTAIPARTIHAPRVAECFLNLECRYLWERERHEGDTHVVVCVEVTHVVMDEARFDEAASGRFGKTGYLYNVHSPTNPLTGKVETSNLAVLEKWQGS